MAAFNFCFKDISIVTVVVESYRIKNSNLFLVTVFNSQFMFFKNKDKKISRVLTTKPMPALPHLVVNIRTLAVIV